MMTRTFALALLAAGFFFFPAILASAAAEKQPPAFTFIQELGNKALVSLTDRNIARSVREDRTRTLLKDYFSVRTIARFALGVNWKTATEKQRDEYFSLFEDMIVDTYATRFEAYSGQSFVVDKADETGKDDSVVASRIIQKDGPDVHIEWRVRNKNGEMKVVDVVVENISMSVTQRSDFAAVIQRGGGKVEALLEKLRTKKKDSAAIAKK